MALFEEIQKGWMDRYGLVSNKPWSMDLPGNASGNGIKYTSEYKITAERRGEWSPDLEHWFIAVIESCEILPGLYSRSPVHRDQEGPDDLVTLAAASPEFARRLLHYGRTRPVKLWGPINLYYFYNNSNPGTKYHRDGKTFNWSAWLGRQPQVIAHFQFKAGEKPPLWRKLWWCMAILWSCRAEKDDQDAWSLSHHLVETARGKSWICDQAGKWWWGTYMMTFDPRERQGICARTLAPGHPLGKAFIL